MKYFKLTIGTRAERFENIKNALETAGFNEMSIDDPGDFLEIEEHPEWYKYDYINEELASSKDRDPVITLYFADDEEERERAEKAKQIAEAEGAECIAELTGDDSEWLYKWQEHFKPAKVGDRIVVRPGWEDYDAKPEEIVIEMDPGMAFGSGLHETTKLCIRALENILQDKKRTGGSDRTENGDGLKVLDVGTGTGILSIAAIKLGAGECLAVDIDADSVRVAGENINRNGLAGRIEVREANLTDGIDYRPDIIVANLMADLVERLSPAAAGHLDKGGIYISSGILESKVDAVADAVRAAGFEIDEVLHDGEWRAIVAQKKRRI